MAHHFILLRLNRFGLSVDREGWCFEHSLSWLRVCLSAESAENVSWPWLSALRGWGSLTMTCTGIFVCVAHHFILVCLNPFGFRIDRELLWFEHSMSELRVCLSAEGAKNVFWSWLSPLRGWGIWLLHVLVYLYIWLTISSCYGSIPLALGLIGRDGGLSTLWHSCGFACKQRVLKIFPGSGSLHSDDGVVWLWHPVVNFYVWLTILSCSQSLLP